MPPIAAARVEDALAAAQIERFGPQDLPGDDPDERDDPQAYEQLAERLRARGQSCNDQATSPSSQPALTIVSLLSSTR